MMEELVEIFDKALWNLQHVLETEFPFLIAIFDEIINELIAESFTVTPNSPDDIVSYLVSYYPEFTVNGKNMTTNDINIMNNKVQFKTDVSFEEAKGRIESYFDHVNVKKVGKSIVVELELSKEMKETEGKQLKIISSIEEVLEKMNDAGVFLVGEYDKGIFALQKMGFRTPVDTDVVHQLLDKHLIELMGTAKTGLETYRLVQQAKLVPGSSEAPKKEQGKQPEESRKFSLKGLYDTTKSAGRYTIQFKFNPDYKKIVKESEKIAKEMLINFKIVAITEEKKYGKKKRVKIAENGEPCSTAYLDTRYNLLIPARTDKISSGMLTRIYVDESGNYTKSDKLLPIDPDGKQLPMLPSSLKTPVELKDYIEMNEVLDIDVSSIYLLVPITDEDEANASNLIAFIKEQIGNVPLFFTFPFLWKAGPVAKTGFLHLLQGSKDEDKSYLALSVGSRNTTQLLNYGEAPEDIMEEEPEIDIQSLELESSEED